MKYTLPALAYAHNALVPHIDEETMKIHHGKHHQGYVDKLNAALEATPASHDTLEDILRNISSYSTAVRNNGGGHYNHTLFWEILSPTPQSLPKGELADAITRKFGSFENFQEQFNNAGATQFGSGWAWLLVKYNGEIEVSSTANQDNPLMDTNPTSQGYPILGIDVWEHAYYLNYQNRRPDYLKAFWSVLDWAVVEKKYQEALAKVK